MPFRDRLAHLRDIASIALAFAIVLGTTLFARAQDVTRIDVSDTSSGEMYRAMDVDPARPPAAVRASARVPA